MSLQLDNSWEDPPGNFLFLFICLLGFIKKKTYISTIIRINGSASLKLTFFV